MTPNKHSRKATVNPTPVSKVSARTSPLTTVKKAGAKYGPTYTSAIISAKRYSFDDNGGGYLGL